MLSPLLEGVEGERLVRDLAAVRGADDLVDVGGGRVAAVQVRVERGVVRLLVEDGDVFVAAAGEVEGGAEGEDARADDVDGRVFAWGGRERETCFRGDFLAGLVILLLADTAFGRMDVFICTQKKKNEKTAQQKRKELEPRNKTL